MFELIFLFRFDDWPISGPTRMENDRRETTTITWEAINNLFVFIYLSELVNEDVYWTQTELQRLKTLQIPFKASKVSELVGLKLFFYEILTIELATFDNFRRILIKRTSADMDSENPGSSVLPLSVRADGQRTENSDRNTDSAVGRRLVSGGLVDIWKFLTLSEKSLNQTKKCCSEIMTAILCLVLRSLTSP